MFRLLVVFVSCLILNSCSSSLSQIQNQSVKNQPEEPSLMLVKNQLPVPQSFKSVQLYRKSNTQNPPIIRLGKNEKLILEFDELTSISGQFRLQFEHFDQNWNPSNIPEAWFIDGFNDQIITGGINNALSKPNYFHYKAEFPSGLTEFITSGNYLVHVYDYTSNTKLFSLPFFVTEQAGVIVSRTETVFNSGSSGEAIDQLFSIYEYPDNVEFPQFDLSFEFVQNRFWGRSITTKSFDTTEKNKIRFYTPRNNSFSSSFDFTPLDLTYLGINVDRIKDWQPEKTPPKVILKRDILNFSATPSSTYRSNTGSPLNSRDAQYAEVIFNLVSGTLNTEGSKLYVAGDFNNWTLSKHSKMDFNTELGLWQTSLLVKQGDYRYKYFQKFGEYDNATALPLNDSISRIKQEYITLVYYKDPTRNYQRLLMVDVR